MKRVWAMPSKDTFTIPPIKELLERYSVGHGWIDPFAGDFSPAEFTNDLNPLKKAKYHLPAQDFVDMMAGHFIGCILDPPYSPRQMKEVYSSIDLGFTKKDGQSAPHCGKIKDALKDKIDIAICFGWNSSGFGKTRGFEMAELLIVNHGGNGHNDTIVTVERKIRTQ